jgi:hypothetical protein
VHDSLSRILIDAVVLRVTLAPGISKLPRPYSATVRVVLRDANLTARTTITADSIQQTRAMVMRIYGDGTRSVRSSTSQLGRVRSTLQHHFLICADTDSNAQRKTLLPCPIALLRLRARPKCQLRQQICDRALRNWTVGIKKASHVRLFLGSVITLLCHQFIHMVSIEHCFAHKPDFLHGNSTTKRTNIFSHKRFNVTVKIWIYKKKFSKFS